MKFILLIVFLVKTAIISAQVSINIVNTSEVVKAEPIDKVQFTVQYEIRAISDTLNPEKAIEETMLLKIGKKSSQYYSYTKFLADSIIEIDKNMGASMEVIQNHVKQYSPKINYKIYKNYPAGKVTTLDQIAINRFRCEEKNEVPAWELLPDTMTILSYPCQKAICRFKGRDYEAWFTTEIPRSEGPWKLHGLPGLILKAQDTRGHYTYQCTGITQSRNDESIMYDGEGHQPTSRKDLNKLYARFAADPIGYISVSSPNVTVKMMGNDGKPAKSPKNMPFNPIELD